MNSSSPRSSAGAVCGRLAIVERRLGQISADCRAALLGFGASGCLTSAAVLLKSSCWPARRRRILRARRSRRLPASRAASHADVVDDLRLAAGLVPVFGRVGANARAPLFRRFGPLGRPTPSRCFPAAAASSVVGPRRLHQFGARLVVEPMSSWASARTCRLTIAGQLLVRRSCRCRRSANSCSPRPAGPMRRAARPAARARQIRSLIRTSPTANRLSIGPNRDPATRRVLSRRKSGDNLSAGVVPLFTLSGPSRATTGRFAAAVASIRAVRAPAIRAAPRHRAPKHPGNAGSEPTSAV